MHPLNLERVYLSAVSEVHQYQCLCLQDGWRVQQTTFIGSNTTLQQLEKWIKLSSGVVLLFHIMLVLPFSYNSIAFSFLFESDITFLCCTAFQLYTQEYLEQGQSFYSIISLGCNGDILIIKLYTHSIIFTNAAWRFTDLNTIDYLETFEQHSLDLPISCPGLKNKTNKPSSLHHCIFQSVARGREGSAFKDSPQWCDEVSHSV